MACHEKPSCCMQYGPHPSSYIDSCHGSCEDNCSSTYSYLASYNNNSKNAPIIIPPPFYQVSHPPIPPKIEIKTSSNYNKFSKAYPRTYTNPSELKLNYCLYPMKGWPMDNPSLKK